MLVGESSASIFDSDFKPLCVMYSEVLWFSSFLKISLGTFGAARCPKEPQEAHNRLLRVPRGHPRGTQERPQGAQEDPRGAQEHPRGTQEATKRHLRGTQESPRGTQEAPKSAQEAAKRYPRGPKRHPREPKRHPRGRIKKP